MSWISLTSFFCHVRYRKGGKQTLLVRQLKMKKKLNFSKTRLKVKTINQKEKKKKKNGKL